LLCCESSAASSCRATSSCCRAALRLLGSTYNAQEQQTLKG
jgi:hypothetical protein